MALTGDKPEVSKHLEENIAWLSRELGVKDSFDMVCREISFAGKKAALFFVDGFAKDQIMMYILRSLTLAKREDLAVNTFDKIVKEYINYIEVTTTGDLHEVVDHVLSGPVALLVDGQEQAIIIDAREYPARNPGEPDLERVVRGSRDGFVETIVFNTALIRRRIRDPQLRTIMLQAGRRSKTDICLAYLEDVANPQLVEEVKGRVETIDIDGLPMAEKSVEELITSGSKWNPFPRVRYTERPDVAAVHLLEGHVLILVDTSPSIMILPCTYFHHLQHAEEYRQAPGVGAFLRWVRFLGIAMAVLLPPLWLLFSLQPDLLPRSLAFIGPKERGAIGLFYQFLLAEGGINLIRMAAVHTPTALATALGLIAAVLVGDIAVSVGLFAPEVVLYAALATIGSFATPSYEMSLANGIVRLFLLVLVGLFQLPGLIMGLLFTLAVLARMESFGVPYLWPLIPFNGKALLSIIVRSPVPVQNTRPSALHPQDRSRQATAPALKRFRPGQEKGKSSTADQKKKGK